jgi:GNAT superfamily N-acetyltransferase
MATYQVHQFTPERANWSLYCDHLNRLGMLHAATRDGAPRAHTVYLGIQIAAAVAGHISIRQQPLTIPASSLTGGDALPLTGAAGEPLSEAFVQSFGVEEPQRRRGIGRALQQAALAQAHALGCWQLRSWSSADRDANYALKISLGFAVVPALYPLPGGAPISGVYFVKRLE